MSDPENHRGDAQFKTGDSQSYDAVADHFHRYTQRFTTHLCQPMLEMAAIPPGGKVLDVGTGTGVIPLAGLESGDADLSFIGIDLSDGMLNKAGQLATEMGFQSRVEFLKMDAENLEFDDNHFDAVISLYALRHFPNPSQALSEIYRVLKPGARAVIAMGNSPTLLSLEGVKAAFRKLGSIWRTARGRELSACGFMESLVEQYLPKTEKNHVTKWVEDKHGFNEPLKDMLGTAGFTNLKTAWKGQYSTISSVDDFWSLQMTFSSKARARIQAADTETLQMLRTTFNLECEKVLGRNGRLVYQSGAAIVSGMKAPVKT